MGSACPWKVKPGLLVRHYGTLPPQAAAARQAPRPAQQRMSGTPLRHLTPPLIRTAARSGFISYGTSTNYGTNTPTQSRTLDNVVRLGFAALTFLVFVAEPVSSARLANATLFLVNRPPSEAFSRTSASKFRKMIVNNKYSPPTMMRNCTPYTSCLTFNCPSSSRGWSAEEVLFTGQMCQCTAVPSAPRLLMPPCKMPPRQGKRAVNLISSLLPFESRRGFMVQFFNNGIDSIGM